MPQINVTRNKASFKIKPHYPRTDSTGHSKEMDSEKNNIIERNNKKQNNIKETLEKILSRLKQLITNIANIFVKTLS